MSMGHGQEFINFNCRWEVWSALGGAMGAMARERADFIATRLPFVEVVLWERRRPRIAHHWPPIPLSVCRQSDLTHGITFYIPYLVAQREIMPTFQ